jgi:uncharacterized protein (DUF488 family)
VTAVVSVGYEGTTPGALVAALAAADVRLLVDVRLNPVSRKPGFSKRALAGALEAAGIGYRHERALGNPVENRDAFRRGDPAAWDVLRAVCEGPAVEVVERLAEDVAAGGVALLCLERDPATCHRSLVVEELARRVPGLEVLDVQPP